MDAEPNKPTLNGQTVRLTYIKMLSTKSHEFNKHLIGGLTAQKKSLRNGTMIAAFGGT